jgi:hypothetical protein
MKSKQAQAASQIRAKFKDAGIKAQIKSFSASMCDGVYIYCQPSDIARGKEINAIAMPYQIGHFNSSEDCYEYSNENAAIPQVKFVMVSYYS